MVRRCLISVSRISAAVPRNGTQTYFLHHKQEVADAQTGLLAAVLHLEGREGVDVDTRDPLLDGDQHVPVLVAGHLRMQSALHADFRSPRLPGLLGPVGDLLDGKGFTLFVAEVLGEGAELAARIADIGEVNVAHRNEGNHVADCALAEFVGGGAESVKLQVLCVEEFYGLFHLDIYAVQGPVQDTRRFRLDGRKKPVKAGFNDSGKCSINYHRVSSSFT